MKIVRCYFVEEVNRYFSVSNFYVSYIICYDYVITGDSGSGFVWDQSIQLLTFDFPKGAIDPFA